MNKREVLSWDRLVQLFKRGLYSVEDLARISWRFSDTLEYARESLKTSDDYVAEITVYAAVINKAEWEQ